MVVAIEIANPTDAYRELLSSYVGAPSEGALYQVSQLAHDLIEQGLGPEDIVALHFEALHDVLAGMSPLSLSRGMTSGYQFLLEVMIGYGVRYREYLELKMENALRDAEHRAQRDRERVLEMERLHHERDELLGAVAHELKTPITVARWQLELISEQIARRQYDEVPSLVSPARQAVDRLSRLTADLVEATRAEVRELRFELVDLVAVVRQACEWAQVMAAAKRIALTPPAVEEPVPVRGNTDALLSACGNLLSNAIRYTLPGGSVTVELGQAERHVWFAVTDTGIGMSPEVQARIFEKFYRAPEARRLESKGLGLGLALVQQMIASHGGQVEVESTTGTGSTFRVLLPSVLNGGAPTAG